MIDLIEKHKKQIQFILNFGLEILTGWEKEFIDSIELQLQNNKDTTFKQQKIVLRIYEKVEGHRA